MKQDFPFFEFEIEQGVYEINDALKSDAPIVHEHIKDNIVVHGKFETDDFDYKFDNSDCKLRSSLNQKDKMLHPLRQGLCCKI